MNDLKQFSPEWWHRKDITVPWCVEFCNPFFAQDSTLGLGKTYKSIAIIFFNKPNGEVVPAGMTALQDGQFIFQYHPSYLADDSVPPISQHLPKRKERFVQKDAMPAFFDNLLSEGSLGDEQGKALGHNIKKPDETLEERYHRLMMFGRDCPGAVWGTYIQLDPELAQHQHHELVQAALQSRSSISGVQPKLLGKMENGVLRPTDYWETSTHIVKLPWEKGITSDNKKSVPAQPGMRTVQDKPGMIEYEYMSLLATKALLPKDQTAHADLTKLHLEDGTTRDVLAIQRFDRTPEGGRVHFEEMNQLMNRSSGGKYLGSYHNMADCVRQRMGQEGVKQLYARLLTQFFLYNTDSHFKNFALFHDEKTDKWSMTPNYDLVPTANYTFGNRGIGELALTIAPLKRAPKQFAAVAAEPATYDANGRENPLKIHHEDLETKTLYMLGSSMGLSNDEMTTIMLDLSANVANAKAVIEQDNSPQLQGQIPDGGRTYKQDFIAKLDGMNRYFFAGFSYLRAPSSASSAPPFP